MLQNVGTPLTGVQLLNITLKATFTFALFPIFCSLVVREIRK